MSNTNIPNPHDRFFKHALSDSRVAKDFFDFHLPDEIKKMANLDQLNLQKTSYVDEDLSLSEVDLLFDVTFAGKSGYFYLLVEHQTKPDPLMAFRLSKYILLIMDKHLRMTQKKELPLIYPLVFYTGEKRYPYSTDLFSLFGQHAELAREIFLKPFKLIELNQIADEVLKTRTWAGIMELAMKHIFDPDILPCLENMVSLLEEAGQSEGVGYVQAALTYLLNGQTEKNQEQLLETLEVKLSERAKGEVMTIADMFREEGRKKAIEEAKKETMTIADMFREEGRKKAIEEAKKETMTIADMFREEGRQEGRKEAMKTLAKSMLSEGMSLESVSHFTGLSLQDLQAL